MIHLTLPMTSSYVTTTETFMTFFINHGLTKALRKDYLMMIWTTDDMQELMMNFQKKHGKKIPLPPIYMDEDSSDSEGLELEDRTRVGRKMSGSGGGNKRKHDNDPDDPEDDPNKRRKTDPSPKPGRHPIVRKEPWKEQATYGGRYLGLGIWCRVYLHIHRIR